MDAATTETRSRAVTAVDASWRAFADARKLRHRKGRLGWAHAIWPRVEGTIDDVPLAIEFSMSGTEPTTVAFGVPATPLAGNLEVRKTRRLDNIWTLLGAQDIHFGDEPFDRTYVVKGSREAVARAILTPEVRREAIALDATSIAYDDGGGAAEGGLVMLSFARALVDAAEIDRAMRVVVAMARVRSA